MLAESNPIVTNWTRGGLQQWRGELAAPTLLSRPVQTPTSPRAVSDREHRREEQAVKCPVSSLHTLAHQLRGPRAILHQWQHVTRAVTQPSIRTIQSCIPQRSPVGLSPHCPHSCQLNKEAPYRGVSPSSPASLSRTPHRWGSLLIK